MSSCVIFRKIDRLWEYSSGAFEIIFGGIVALYIDKSRAKAICVDLKYQIGDSLRECWPEKYADEVGSGIDTLDYSKFSLAEQLELLRAAEAMLGDFVADRLDRQWEDQMRPGRRPHLIKILGELIALMREELAAA